MSNSQAQALVIATLILLVIFVVMRKWSQDADKDSKEDYSYHFGFPTWGQVNNSYYGLRYNPFMWSWRPFGRGYSPYYYDSVAPYLTNRCYSSNESSDCVPGYAKIGKDTDNDGAKDKWQCCRRTW